MLFSCPTLDGVLYQVRRVSEQLCSVCNVVFYEVLRVSKQVSLNPVVLPPTSLQNFLWLLLSFNVCYYLSINL